MHIIRVAPEVTVKSDALPLHCEKLMDCETVFIPSPISILPASPELSIEKPEPKTSDVRTFKMEVLPPNFILPVNMPVPVEFFKASHLVSERVQEKPVVLVRLNPARSRSMLFVNDEEASQL